MISPGGSAFPLQVDVRLRQGDLGRDGSASTVGMARWLEDARIRVRMRRFEQLVGTGEFGPFHIVLVSQHVERLAAVRRTGTNVQVHTGVRRAGRSSFTFEQSILAGDKHVGNGGATVILAGAAGPLQLPDALLADLADLRLPDSDQAAAPRPGTERHQREHYAHFTPLHARIGDVDANQHVNFMALATWYDEAVARFTLEAAGEPVPDLPPWSYRIQYVGEVTYPGEYEIGTLVRSFDADSVHYELGIFLDGTCIGVADAVGPRGALPAEYLRNT